jgi:hypothetical protein
MKNQIHSVLREAMSYRVVQHVPSDMSVMSVKENIKGYEVLDDKWVLVHQQVRDPLTGKLKTKEQKVAKDKLVGLGRETGKLAAVKGVLEITENMAVALVVQASDREESPPMLVIPLHAASERLQKFRKAHPRKKVALVRKGSLLRFTSGLHSDRPVWKVFGVDNHQTDGPQLKIALPDTVSLHDEPKPNYKRLTLRNRWQDIDFIQPPFTGSAPCPITSSA